MNEGNEYGDYNACRGSTVKMENKMKSTIVYWGCTGIMEQKWKLLL